MKTALYQVDAPHFCAGIEVEIVYGGVSRVVGAAPILKWTIGKPWPEIRAYFARKGFAVVNVPPVEKGGFPRNHAEGLIDGS